MTILKIRFKRELDSEYENGLYIEGDQFIIIDANGVVITEMIYTLERCPYEFCMDFSGLIK